MNDTENKAPETPMTDTEKTAREAEDRKSRIRAAAILYIGAGRKPASIARMLKVSIDTLNEWINSPDWKEALQFWGFSGEEAYPLRNRKQSTQTPLQRKLGLINQLENEFGHTPAAQRPAAPRQLKEYDEDERTPYPLTEKYLIEQAFAKEGEVRFVTYAKKFTDDRVKKVDRYEILFDSPRNPLEKITVLLVFPKSKMPAIRNGIKRRESLADKHLPPERDPKRRKHFTIDAPRGSLVQCVMRNGLVVTGKLVWVGKWNLILRVGEDKRGLSEKAREGKIVLVYRHGLDDFQTLNPKKKNNRRPLKNDYWESEEE